MPSESAADKVKKFKSDLGSMNVSHLIERHVIFGSAFALEEDRYFSLKIEIAERFNIDTPEVVMVGSGKLGFSIAPKKQFREFGETSDIDLAIVSAHLFDQIWYEVFEHKQEIGYWPKEKRFNDYLAQGWIRPDKLPSSRLFRRSREWWLFFEDLSSSGRYGSYKIRAGLYRSWKFLRTYQTKAVYALKESVG